MFSSCELDQYPAGSIPFERSWEKVSDAENYQRGLLASMRSVSGGSYAYVSEVQTDLFNALVGIASLKEEHTWTFTNVVFAGEAVYSGNYSCIYDANNIISNIHKIPVTTEADSVKLAAIKGSAYFMRAFAHFNITLRYSKDYEPETAEKELGIALVKDNDITAKPARATLQETYEFICNDLDSARKYMANERPLYDINKGIDDVHIFGLDALDALSARIYLYMHRYQDAIDATENIMPYYPLISNRNEFADMWLYDRGDEIIFEPFQEKENEQANSYSAFISYNSSYGAMRPSFIPTKGLMDMYDSKDIRRTVYFKDMTIANNNGELETGSILYKFPGNPNLAKNKLSDFYNMAKVFRSAELYLIAAESAYNLGEHGDARYYLNELRVARGLDETNKSGSELFTEIKNEWTREMAGEGFRLDCLKRWHEGFTRLTPQKFTTNMLIRQAGYDELTIKADNMKFVWEIPSNDLQANTNLERNWITND